MTTTPAPTPAARRAVALDLDACAREPIHAPGSIQPHGAMLVLEAERLTLRQWSANAGEMLDARPAAGLSLEALCGADFASALAAWQAGGEPRMQRTLTLRDRRCEGQAHLTPQGVLLEIEPSPAEDAHLVDSLYPRIQRFIERHEGEADVAELGRQAAIEVRHLTGFHRVMVYRFDEDWHGTVIAEDGDGRLPSYRGLRFPASDIPAQARELYRRQRLRLIPDAEYRPVPIEPAASPLDGTPLDLSGAALRSVAPVHLEYMRNMGTAASMSVSILIDGHLWGLISCHHAEPRIVGPRVRAACDVLGQMLALQIGARERSHFAQERLGAKDLEAELLARISRAGTVQGGLGEDADAWLRLAEADGAAVVRDGAVFLAGRTPTMEQTHAIAAWLHAEGHGGQGETAYATHTLPADYPPAAEFVDTACGLLAVRISALHANYILWFRPEIIHTVQWGGEPAKVDAADGRLHPRRSFSIWTEQVRGRAARWSPVQIDAVQSLRNAVVNFVLKRAEERAELTEKLRTSNRELEAFSYSVSHDLRAPFRHIIGFAQLLGESEPSLAARSRHYLDTIVDSALSAGRLVDDLLTFSQLGRSGLEISRVDMAKVAAEVRQSMRIDEGRRRIEWRIGPLPPTWGDASMLRQVLSNLMDNALKYTRDRDPAIIEIEGERRAHETVYTVRDNGIGFDMAYVGKLFGVFQRLHRVEDYEGSGIGLALARRIVDRHGGWIAAEGTLNAGATFRFGLPERAGDRSRADADDEDRARSLKGTEP